MEINPTTALLRSARIRRRVLETSNHSKSNEKPSVDAGLKNSQIIIISHTVYREDHRNLESGIDSRRKKLNRRKDPVRHIPGKCIITITIRNSDDATQSHSQEMHSRIQTQLIARKDQPLNVNRRHQTVRKKNKNKKTKSGRELETLKQTVWIYSQDIGMEFSIEKFAMLVIKCGKRHMTEGIELPN